MKPSEFLRVMWGDPPPGLFYVWTFPDKESSWYSNYDTVDSDFAEQGNRDIYIGMSSLPKNAKVRRKQRLSLETRMAGIPGLWADLDWLDEAHNKTKLPPNEEAIMAVLEQLDYEPTIIVNSGHGLHIMWLFETPWLFEDDREQRQAAQVVYWWQNKIREIYTTKGWELDSTHPLTQLLRIPGFYNLKREPIVPVTLISADGPRLNVARITQHAQRDRAQDPRTYSSARFAGDDARRKRGIGSPQGDAELFGFRLDGNANPPQEKLDLALENIDNFRATWEYRRTDLHDTSASVHDLSLASMAARLQWSKQEIIDLLIAFRRRNNIEPKLRYDYYEMTLALAMEPIDQEKAQESLHATMTYVGRKEREAGRASAVPGEEEIPPEAGRATGSRTDDADRRRAPDIDDDTSDAIRRNLSTLWGVEIYRVIKYLGEPAVYWISTSRGSGTIGGIREIVDQESFRRRLADITGELIKLAKNKTEWETRAKGLLAIRQDVDVGDASFPREETKNWIRQYLEVRRPQDSVPEEARVQSRPFICNGNVMIQADNLRDYIMYNLAIEISRPEMGRRLRQVGATPETAVTTKKNTGERTSRLYWEIDPEKLEDEPEDTGG